LAGLTLTNVRGSLTALAGVIIFGIQPPGVTPQSAPGHSLAIEHVTVLPMDRDIALADHTVLVAQGLIAWVGPSKDARVPAAATRVDGRGTFLMPGLADMHVHIQSVEDLRQFVAAGITTVRNMHGGPQHVEWREQVARGTLLGPAIVTSGPPLGQGFWRDSRFIGLWSTADAENVVRDHARAGYDMLKVIQKIDAPVYRRLLDAARAADMPVVGHVVPGIGLHQSLSAGQVSLEHADGLAPQSRFAFLFGDDPAGFDEDARAIARAGAWVGTIASSRTGGCEPPTATIRRNLGALRRANVKLLAGSDAGIGAVRAGPSLHCELATLVAAGLTPFDALASATANAGAFARAHLKRLHVPFGTVTAGARADLVLLSADPRADIGAVARQLGVVLRGSWRPR
jgi:imidazolonepropionase-like amidohydrolase